MNTEIPDNIKKNLITGIIKKEIDVYNMKPENLKKILTIMGDILYKGNVKSISGKQYYDLFNYVKNGGVTNFEDYKKLKEIDEKIDLTAETLADTHNKKTSVELNKLKQERNTFLTSLHDSTAPTESTTSTTAKPATASTAEPTAKIRNRKNLLLPKARGILASVTPTVRNYFEENVIPILKNISEKNIPLNEFNILSTKNNNERKTKISEFAKKYNLDAKKLIEAINLGGRTVFLYNLGMKVEDAKSLKKSS